MKKILIIDDDTVFQKTMGSKLEEAGLEVVSAVNGEEGMIQVLGEKPDLILLDIKMPKLDGMGFLKELRAHPNAPTMPILITSNLSAMEQISEGVSLGIRGYIVKSNETLGTILEQVQNILKNE